MGRIRLSLFVSLIFLSTLMTGCEESSNPFSKFGDDVVGAHQRTTVKADQMTLNGMKDAVRAYHISNGTYPASLEEIQKLMGSPIDIGLYEYDPDTGEISPAG